MILAIWFGLGDLFVYAFARVFRAILRRLER